MVSTLIITSVEKLQKAINKKIAIHNDIPGIYVSLNKTQKSLEKIFNDEKINIDKIFFIDCVSQENLKQDVLHIAPNDLDKLKLSIKTFINQIKGKKFLLIDALSTLLIYNNENKVAAFVQEITELSSTENFKVIALSPKTKGEELLNKIFNFFDKVIDEENKNKKSDDVKN